jgi:hypothetical protein
LTTLLSSRDRVQIYKADFTALDRHA